MNGNYQVSNTDYMHIYIYKHAILQDAILQDKIGRLKFVLDKHPQQQDRNLDIRRPWWNPR